jgi:hypothetical protein
LLEIRSGRAKLKEYLNKSNTFIYLLYAAMHITDGMLARGEEFRILR